MAYGKFGAINMQVPTKENPTGVCSIRKNSSHGRSLRTGASGVPMG